MLQKVMLSLNLFFIVFVVFEVSNAAFDNATRLLIDLDLFPDRPSPLVDGVANLPYSKAIIPPIPASANCSQRCAFMVQTRIFLIRIHDVQESSETLHSTLRLQLGWNDTRLAWNPANYGGIKTLLVPGGSLWTPDLQLVNSIDDNYALSNSDMFKFKLSSNGEIYYHPTAKLSTRCQLNLEYYPFDYQLCAYVIESVTHTVDELRLIITRTPVTLTMYAANEQWILVNSTGFPMTYRTSNSTAFSRVHFWLLLQRRPEWVEATFILPIGLLSLLQLITLVMPINLVDRVGQATVVMLSVAFYQGTVTANLPETSQQSRVASYLTVVMGMSIGVVFICVVTLALAEPNASVTVGPDDESDEEGRKTKRRSRHYCWLAALIINWLGFLACATLIVVYPCVTFLEIKYNAPPELPKAPIDSITTNYYPEITF